MSARVLLKLLNELGKIDIIGAHLMSIRPNKESKRV